MNRGTRVNRGYYGDGRRLEFQENELANAPVVPNPVEYEDIDRAVFDFFRDNIAITDENGESLPTFRLFSNQRFTEYSQTWRHTDKDGNLLMNFKTVSREPNPQSGKIHNGMANIPGWNRFTVCMRDILDKNGVECYEITSMSQPVQADMQYTVGIVCSKMDKINSFNLRLNQLFQSKQCYICVNGHYMPMMLENIGDDSRYSVDDRKFFNQTASVRVMAYVIPKDDIKVELKPKRVSDRVGVCGSPKTYVDMDFIEDSDRLFKLNVKYSAGTKAARFVVEDNMKVRMLWKENANSVRVYVNGDECGENSDILLKRDDNVAVFIAQPNRTRPATVVFYGEIS